MSAPTLGQRAIGSRDGDYLIIKNLFARLIITREAENEYVVVGDMLDFRDTSKTFRTMGTAVHYCMQSLAAYQEGRTS